MKAPAIGPPGVVAITGGGRGIGRATAEAFLAAGFRVAVGDLDPDTLSWIEADSFGAELDVRSRDSFAAFVDGTEEALGPIDVLVNNAGVMPIARFLDERDATSAVTLDVNVWGPIHGTRLVAPGMIERGRGHIVNVASGLGKVSVPGLAVYVASKHAVVGLSASLRQELEGTGVTVTTVMPSAVRTELSAGIPKGFGLPMVDPADVASAIVRSCRRRPAEVGVPRWTGPVLAMTQATPAPLRRLIDRALKADRAITQLDQVGRAAYERRVRGQAAEPSGRS